MNINCSVESLEYVVDDDTAPHLITQVALHPYVTSEILAKIIDRAIKYNMGDISAQYAANNPKAPPELLAQILEGKSDSFVARAAANNPITPPEALAHAVINGDVHVAELAAKNFSTPPEALVEAAKTRKGLVRINAINNLNFPIREKYRLLKERQGIDPFDDSDRIVQELDQKQDTGGLEEFGNLLSEDSSELIKESIKDTPDWYNQHNASDPKTDPDILRNILALRRYDMVSRDAANNPSTPPDILAEILLEGKMNYVRYDIAKNPRTPASALTEAARTFLDRSPTWDDYDGLSLLDFICRNPNAPSDVLGQVLLSEYSSAAHYAAKHANTPPEALAEIIDSGEDTNVSWEVARNINTPADALERAMDRAIKDKRPNDTLWYIYSNPNAPIRKKIEIQKLFRKNKPSEDFFQELDTQKEDNSLDEFGDLLSSNKFNLREASGGDEFLERSLVAEERKKRLQKRYDLAIEKYFETGEDTYDAAAAATGRFLSLETLLKILAKKKNDRTSYQAANNGRVSKIEKLKWDLAVGNKDSGDLDQDLDVQKEDNSLDEFGDLLSSNKFNLKKHSAEDFFKEKRTEPPFPEYDMVIASNPKTDPDVLLRIVKEYNDDWVTRSALENPNCPPEAIKFVLNAGEAGIPALLYKAAIHPNADPYDLHYYIKLQKSIGLYALNNPILTSDYLRRLFRELRYTLILSFSEKMNAKAYVLGVVSHHNFPMEEALELLSEGVNDFISRSLSRHPKIPLKDKIEWKRAVMPKASEDLIQSLDKEERSSGIDELGDLLSKKVFNLKKLSSKGKTSKA
jgi:hypothetical protein